MRQHFFESAPRIVLASTGRAARWSNKSDQGAQQAIDRSPTDDAPDEMVTRRLVADPVVRRPFRR